MHGQQAHEKSFFCKSHYLRWKYVFTSPADLLVKSNTSLKPHAYFESCLYLYSRVFNRSIDTSYFVRESNISFGVSQKLDVGRREVS
jgi:hypothetical protein